MSNLSSLVGQDGLKEALRHQIREALSRSTHLPHILLCGPSGRGKSAFAAAIAYELGVEYKSASARSIRDAGDLAALLTNLEEGDILEIQDIDAIPGSFLDILIGAVGIYEINLVIGRGSDARSVGLELPHFSLIGTTSKPSRVDEKLSRWMISYHLLPYTDCEMQELLALLASNYNLILAPEAAKLLVKHSESSLEIASVLLRKLRNHNYHIEGYVSLETATAALRMLGYQQTGMNLRDILKRVREMSGVEFERFVADIFQKQGYLAELTVASGDHGIDIILRKPGQMVAVQCKQWGNVIGEPVLRDFYGAVMNARADVGFLVTSSSFTVQAEKFAENKPLKLFDIDAVIQLYLDTVGNTASETY